MAWLYGAVVGTGGAFHLQGLLCSTKWSPPCFLVNNVIHQKILLPQGVVDWEVKVHLGALVYNCALSVLSRVFASS